MNLVNETTAYNKAALANNASFPPPGARTALLLTLGRVPCSLVIRSLRRSGFQLPLKYLTRLLCIGRYVGGAQEEGGPIRGSQNSYA